MLCLTLQFCEVKRENISYNSERRSRLLDKRENEQRFRSGISKVALFLGRMCCQVGLVGRYFTDFWTGKSKFIAPDALIFMPHGFKRTIERRDLAALALLRIRNSEAIDSRILVVSTLLSPFNSPTMDST